MFKTSLHFLFAKQSTYLLSAQIETNELRICINVLSVLQGYIVEVDGRDISSVRAVISRHVVRVYAVFVSDLKFKFL